MPVPDREVSREVGVLIRDRMYARGLSQTKVAHAVGLTQPHLSRCLSGETHWDVDSLAAVCTFLDTRASDVLAVAEDLLSSS